MSKDINVRASATGLGWGTFWMFTIAMAKLSGGKAILALIVWPYYLGEVLAR